MDLGLVGRKALITGASMGIGAAIARRLAAEGCHTVIVARSAAKLSTVKRDIETRFGRYAEAWVEDLSRPGIAKALATKFPDVDILVNNAGDIPLGDIFDVDEKTWRDAWELKVFGYINMCREFYRIMSDRGKGTIINIIGAAAFTKSPQYICGVAGNSALTAMTQALGSNSLAKGVRILGVAPGLIATERVLRSLKVASEPDSGFSADEVLVSAANRVAEKSGLPRAGRAEEVADLVAHLSSDRAEFTTGSVISIDGGQSKN